MDTIKLKRTLLGNAVFSFLSSLILIIANEYITHLFGLTNGLAFYIIGGVLIAFSGFILYTMKKKIENKMQVLSISVADFAWVAGSLVIIATSAFQITQIGYEIIGLVAFIVLLFGILQLKFIR